jgi:hypothetical protein
LLTGAEDTHSSARVQAGRENTGKPKGKKSGPPGGPASINPLRARLTTT